MKMTDKREGFEFTSEGEAGVLLLHGFTGTPFEMRPLGEFLNKAGLTVFCPRLAGHGTSEEELNRCRFYDWIESAEKGLIHLRERCKKISVIGLSMGGLLTLKLASLHKEIEKVVVIASPLFLTGENGIFVTACRFKVFRYFVKSVKKPAPKDERYRTIWEQNPSYREVPTNAAFEFYKLMQNVRASLKSVEQKTMFIYSRGDKDVDFSNLYLMLSLIGSREISLYLPKSMGHLITLEEGNTTVFSKILDFISK